MGRTNVLKNDPLVSSNLVLLKVQDLYAAVNMPNYSVLANRILHSSSGTVNV